MRLSVVIPAYDEGTRIAATVRDVHACLSTALADDFEIVVIDDGSTDDTLEAAMDAADAHPRCRVLSYGANVGKGYALRRGVRSAKGDLVAFFDADGELVAGDLLAMVAALPEEASGVVGRRRWTRPRAWYRRLGSSLLSRLARLTFDLSVPETQAGVKVFVRRDVDRIVKSCRQDGYLFDLELLARMHRKGHRTVSFGIVQTPTRPWRIGIGTGVREMLRIVQVWRDVVASPRPTRPARLRARALSLRSTKEEQLP